MAIVQTVGPALRKPLRLWPGIAIVSAQWLARFVVPVSFPDAANYGVIAGLLGGVLLLLWWLLFSRAPWPERVGAIVLMAVGVAATSHLVHESIANGMMGLMLPIFVTPFLSLALVAWAVASGGLSTGQRRASLAVSILLACGVFTLVRTGGISGDGVSDLHWRWTLSPEERLLARSSDNAYPRSTAPAAPKSTGKDRAVTVAVAPAPPSPPSSAEGRTPVLATPVRNEPDGVPPAQAGAETAAEWPGFRGPNRDGVIRGVQIQTDWNATPPVELWRRPIGPGWSSFAVHGDLVYTQEQRGDDESVSCYRLTTGDLVWRHLDAARFWESNGGAGPRATPFLNNGRVYTLGATGILNALDASDGALLWTRNAATDTGATNPGWGFSGSPLVVEGLVIVAASGRLAAYDAATGDPRWSGPKNGAGYSSPHLVTIDATPQVLLLRGARTTSFAPSNGAVLWEHSGPPSVSIVQPAFAENGDLLIAPGDSMGGAGVRRLAVSRKAAGWSVAERWTSRGLKPYFNDFVVHKGHAFGFDGSILSCIDLANGERKWKGGRYGSGQLVLLPDQDLLLVLSEKGELALVGATPDQFKEFARIKAIEGKAWNHPVVVGDRLLVRNGEEMAAFRLPAEVRP